jgi:hypothetical protein
VTQVEIWTPSMGMVPPHIATAQKAVEEYDADLLIGQDTRNGDWVVLLDSRREVGPHPVLRLGPRLPGADEIKKRLYEADTRRRGHEIVNDIARYRAQEEARMRAETHDAAGEVAEALDVLMRKEGRHPVPRIFVPGGKD